MQEEKHDKLIDDYYFKLQNSIRHRQKWGKLTQKDITTLVELRSGLIHDIMNLPHNAIFMDKLDSIYKITKILELGRE